MITSPQNEKLKLVRRLRTRQGRSEGLFVTEGEDLLEAGLAAGATPRFVLAKPGSGIDGEEVAPELLDALSELGSGTRVLAVWPTRDENAAVAGPAVYLHGVADPGNVGTIIRTVDALLGGAVVLGPGTADPHGPKAVRATMGAIFRVPTAMGRVGETPAPRIGLVSAGGATLGEVVPDLEPRTICLGAERDGLPDEVLAECDAQVTIPMRGRGAESLNVAAAAAIAIHALSSAAVSAGADDA